MLLAGRLEDHLLALAGAVAPDGGDGVVGLLRNLLERGAPYDAGEVAVRHPAGYERWTFTDDESPLLGEELLLHVEARPHPLRIDELGEAEPYPRTLELLRRRGLNSLLVLPLGLAGGAPGAIGLGAAHGWAFTGCSLRQLVPVAAMGGLALAQARGLRALRERVRAAPGSDGNGGPSHATHSLDGSEAARRGAQLQLELNELRAELGRERERGSELDARLARLVEEREGMERELVELRVGQSPRVPGAVLELPQAGPPPSGRKKRRRR